MRSRRRPTVHIVALGLLASVIIGSGPATRITQCPFTFKNKPINPLCLEPLVGDLAGERPAVAAVDLEGSQGTRIAESAATVSGDVTSAKDGEGYVAYRHLGTTPSGVHALILMVNGGGSGGFEDVLWVRLVHNVVSENGATRDRTMLLKVGSFTLGDRDDGDVRLDGARLLVGQSKYRAHATIIPIE